MERPQRARRESVKTVSATDAKHLFGSVLESAIRGERVVITRHETPRAVLISWEHYRELTAPPLPTLDELTAEFDALLAKHQTPRARKGMKAAFDASPEQLGAAALAGARRRKKRRG
jgi:prevent-host-death family protein